MTQAPQPRQEIVDQRRDDLPADIPRNLTDFVDGAISLENQPRELNIESEFTSAPPTLEHGPAAGRVPRPLSQIPPLGETVTPFTGLVTFARPVWSSITTLPVSVDLLSE